MKFSINAQEKQQILLGLAGLIRNAPLEETLHVASSLMPLAIRISELQDVSKPEKPMTATKPKKPQAT
jgi:hypothetical protein